MSTEKICFDITDNTVLINLCGPMDEHIKQVADHFNVSINRHGECFQIEGQNTKAAIASLKHFYAQAQLKPLSIEDVQLQLTSSGNIDPEPQSNIQLHTKRGHISGKTFNQNQYIKAILNNDITFGIGPAGTGKTYLAVACACDLFEKELIKRIVLVRPAVEAGEKLGFLPGDLAQKVDPYLRPLYDALYDLLGFEKVSRMFEKNLIEIAPLAFMRGRTLNNSIIILDEAQNTTPEQMKMFLTRIGFGSKAIITGDITQIDLDRKQQSGLVTVERILQDIRGIYFHHFTKQDVVRHPLVQKIVEAYDHKNS